MVARAKAYDTTLADAYIALFVFDHPEMVEPLFLTDAGADLMVGGDLFRAVPIRLGLPDQSEDSPPVGRVVLDNVDRTAIAAVRSISTPMTCEVQVVLRSDPASVELGPLDFEVRNVRWDAVSLSADLVHEPILGVAIPADTYNPADFPGMRR